MLKEEEEETEEEVQILVVSLILEKQKRKLNYLFLILVARIKIEKRIRAKHCYRYVSLLSEVKVEMLKVSIFFVTTKYSIKENIRCPPTYSNINN